MVPLIIVSQMLRLPDVAIPHVGVATGTTKAWEWTAFKVERLGEVAYLSL
ncbi:hypothetical protein ACFLXE_04615 [Chloroflexota bacterium]